jgi:hypothetical protein
MPIQTKPDHIKKFVHTLCTEIVTLEEITHYLKTVWLDKAIYGYNELVDYTTADLSQIAYSDLLTAATESSKIYTHDPQSKCALLISSFEHQQMADFYIGAQALIKDPTREMKSFRSREEAMIWLAVD